MLFWYLVACFFSITLHGMEPTPSIENIVQTYVQIEGTNILDHLCENSYSLAYTYTQSLCTIRLLNKHFQQKVTDTTKKRSAELNKAVEDMFLRTGKYNKDSVCINARGTSIGWLQSFCTQCISPGHCTCDVSVVPSALYRAQIVGSTYTRPNEQKLSQWIAKPRIEVHKVCIESPMLRNIIDCIQTIKKWNAKKEELDDIYVPDFTYCIPWGCLESTERYSEALQPFNLCFNYHDDLELYYIEKLKDNREYYHTYSIRTPKHYSKVNTLNYQGIWKQRDVVFTFEDDDQIYELSCITHLPTLYDILIQAPKMYADDLVTINATAALAATDTMPRNHHATLRYALPSPNNHYKIDIPQEHLCAVLRCAQIGGLTADNDKHHLINRLCCERYEIHKIHNCTFYTTVCLSLSDSTIKCHHPGENEFIFCTNGGYSSSNHNGHDTMFAMLSKYSIDTAHCFTEELEQYKSYFIEPPKPYKSNDTEQPFFVIEVRKKPNTPKELHVWKRDRFWNYRDSQVYSVFPLWPYMIPLSINDPGLMIPINFCYLQQHNNTQKSTQLINVLTEEEQQEQKTIENSSEVLPDNAPTAPLYSKSWQDYMMQPIKMINLSICTIKPQHLINLLNPQVWIKALYPTIENLCTRMKSII